MKFTMNENDNFVIREEYLRMSVAELEKREAAMKEQAVAEVKAAAPHDKSISWIKI